MSTFFMSPSTIFKLFQLIVFSVFLSFSSFRLILKIGLRLGLGLGLRLGLTLRLGLGREIKNIRDNARKKILQIQIREFENRAW